MRIPRIALKPLPATGLGSVAVLSRDIQQAAAKVRQVGMILIAARARIYWATAVFNT